MRWGQFLIAAALTAVLNPADAAATAAIEELVLITPVGKSLSDPALAEFTNYARERWNATFRKEIESVAEELKRRH